MQRVIDKYLINFTISANGKTLVPRSLNSSMMHKRTRNFMKKPQIIGAKELISLDDNLNLTRFYKHCIREFASELLLKRPFNA